MVLLCTFTSFFFYLPPDLGHLRLRDVLRKCTDVLSIIWSGLKPQLVKTEEI